MTEDNGNRTHYVVLEYVSGSEDETGKDVWRMLGQATANNADQARRLVAQEQLGLDALKTGVILIAITLRAWDAGQGTVHAKTETRVVST